MCFGDITVFVFHHVQFGRTTNATDTAACELHHMQDLTVVQGRNLSPKEPGQRVHTPAQQPHTETGPARVFPRDAPSCNPITGTARPLPGVGYGMYVHRYVVRQSLTSTPSSPESLG